MKNHKRTIKWSLLLLLLVFTYFFGIYSYKNDGIRDSLISIYKLKNIHIGNYITNKNQAPPTFEIIIPSKSEKIIQMCRDTAISIGKLPDAYKIYVPARLVFDEDTLKIKMRLKGDYSDHWGGDKWSYRIKVKGDNRVYGMKSFSIQDPKTRKGLSEWYFHSMLKEEGLISLRQKFVTVVENGIIKGVYNLEESFDKQLLENSNRREAPILKFDESIWINPNKINQKRTYSQENIFIISNIDLFKTKRTLKNDLLYDQYQKGKLLINNIRSHNIKLSEGIDIDKAARLFAIADLTGGHHGLRWKNIRFYFNPVIGKLELIGFDSNSGNSIQDIYYNLWSRKRVGMYDVYAWKDIFFKDSEFVNLYFKYLKKFSEPEYLHNFNMVIAEEMDKNLSYINYDDPGYNFQPDIYINNARIISEKVALFEKGNRETPNKYFLEIQAAESFIPNNDEINIIIKNNSKQEINILGIFDSFKNKISNEENISLNGRKDEESANAKVFQFKLITNLDSNQIKVKKKGNLLVYKKIKVGFNYPYSNDTLYKKIEQFYDPQIKNEKYSLPNEAFIVDHETKSIKIIPGDWLFKNDIITPSGYTVYCEKNTRITLDNHSTLTMNGKINFIGTNEEPIIIESKDLSGSFIVYQAEGKSILNYVKFIGLSESHHSKWHLTGAVNFYESDVLISYVTIINNKSEDALNIFLSDFELSNVIFKNIYSDAFDGDFSNGRVIDAYFEEIGNDALDFSGSNVTLENIVIKNVGDKGISAGEKSTIKGTNINILNGELGLVSKDQSLLSLDQINLDNISVPFIVFKKKNEFGPAKIELTNFQFTNYKEKYLVEDKSIAIVNGKQIESNSNDVHSILYGNLYGKMSVK